MYKKDKGQTQAIQWKKIQRTNRGHAMCKKDNGQTQAIQLTKKTKDKHSTYNGK